MFESTVIGIYKASPPTPKSLIVFSIRAATTQATQFSQTSRFMGVSIRRLLSPKSERDNQKIIFSSSSLDWINAKIISV